MKVRVIKPNQKKGIVQVSKTNSDQPDIISSIQRFNAAFEQVKGVVLDRSEEIDALKLAILVREHVMLEGKHGIAKSMLADEACKRITGSKLFDILLMKGTQADEIFGPMNAEIYRSQARWERNTEGFLPEADFAFIDETYRGSDAILGSLLGIMNERKFSNGPVKMRCPLITMIGTTNFVTVAEELEAFHDRWLVKALINPLQHKNMRLGMLGAFLARISGEEAEGEFKSVSLDEINLLQNHLSEVGVSSEMLELFTELCDCVAKNISPRPYISDRRLCLTLKLVVAEAMMCNLWELRPEHLTSAKFGLCKINDSSSSGSFDAAYQVVVGNFSRRIEENRQTSEVREYVEKLKNLFNSNLEEQSLQKLYKRVVEATETITAVSGDEAPRESENVNAYRQFEEELSDLKHKIEGTPAMRKILSKKGVGSKGAANVAAEKVRAAMALDFETPDY